MRSKTISIASPHKGPYDFASERAQNVIGLCLQEARKGKGFSLSELSELLRECGIEISKSNISKWERGEVVPSAYQLVALCRVLGIDDDLSYFTSDHRLELNAAGIKKVQSYRDDLIASGRYAPTPPRVEIEYIDMPVSFLAVSAGTGEFLSEGSFETVSFPKASVPAGASFGVRVHGDSMEPVYHDGQIVWVQETPDVLPGEEGIFIYDGCGYMKLLQMHTPNESLAEQFLDSENTLHAQPVLVSYNQSYAPIIISPELSFQIVGRVL